MKSSKNFQIQVLFTAALMCFFSSSGHAQTRLDQNPTLSHQIDELKISLDQLFAQIDIQIGDRYGYIPDYPRAYENYVDRAEVSIKEFKSALGEIKKQAELELSQMQNALNALVVGAERNPTRVNLALVELQKERNQLSLARLIQKSNDAYHLAIQNLVSLHEILFLGSAKDWRIDRLKVFQDCKTGGCVYQISSEYLHWILESQVANVRVDLGSGVMLEPAELPKTSWINRIYTKETASAADQRTKLMELK